MAISVLTQSREDLIDRTLDACVGLPRATVHLYNALSPLFREVVFRMSRQDVHELAVDGIRMVMARADKVLTDDTVFGFEYSPEIFVDTEREYSLEVCEAVMDVWQPEADREIILNLPATVDRATPNVYADQIEWVSRNLSRRDVVALGIISAYAGCTRSASPRCRASGDHPRLRGVHVVGVFPEPPLPGSSPLTRGAPTGRTWSSSPTGIIPAYAGCTPPGHPCPRRAPDHPRLRGVHALINSAHAYGWGSSPLTRGAPNMPPRITMRNRIIPAYAGCTNSRH